MKKTATILASLSLALGLAAPLAPAASAFAATTQTQTVKSATVGFKLYKTGTTDASSASRFLPQPLFLAIPCPSLFLRNQQP